MQYLPLGFELGIGGTLLQKMMLLIASARA